MRDFDGWLRDALIDANLLQFEAVLADADAREFDFSPRYCRQRMRMLADPFGWAKRQGRSPWVRAARNAACVLLACTVALGALMAASPAVRAAVLGWLREFGGDTVTYSSPYCPAPADAGPQDWRLTWLPEGYTLQEPYINSSISKWSFLSADTGDTLDFGCSAPGGDSRVQVGTLPEPERVWERVSVRGIPADYYAGDADTSQLLVWETPEGFLLRLLARTQIDRETLVKIAESAVCYGGSAPAYEMGWIPPDFRDMGNPRGNGVFHQEWVRRGVILSWQYLVDPVCPFAAPEGTPEEITVGGLPGRFWACREASPGNPGGPDDSVMQFGDVTITTGSSPAEETVSTLMWEDPETNTAFCLRGELGKSDLLRMAESVRRLETPVERP